MKSLQVDHLHKIGVVSDTEMKKYSDLQVLKSPAGYYVGTVYTCQDGFIEPGSRDTYYYLTESTAKLALSQIESGIFDMSKYRFNA